MARVSLCLGSLLETAVRGNIMSSGHQKAWQEDKVLNFDSAVVTACCHII